MDTLVRDLCVNTIYFLFPSKARNVHYPQGNGYIPFKKPECREDKISGKNLKISRTIPPTSSRWMWSSNTRRARLWMHHQAPLKWAGNRRIAVILIWRTLYIPLHYTTSVNEIFQPRTSLLTYLEESISLVFWCNLSTYQNILIFALQDFWNHLR